MGRIARLAAAETREQLMRPAVGTFAERGYDGPRVAHIAAPACVSSGAPYAHFGPKAELFIAL
jgi:AcrR family transcriptional regulator